MKTKFLMFALCFTAVGFVLTSFTNGDLTALEIVKKADQKLKGVTAQGEIKMTIVRPSWTREVTMKTWSKGDDYSLTLITGPARDKGTAFLKRKKEIWNWQPTIDRVIKLPPSMMMQSWMGSDFTNDDLVKQSSIVVDYEHSLLGEEELEGRMCYKIQLIPKEESSVVWGKIILWISKKEFLELKTEFYDEDDYLVNTMLGKDVKELGGKLLPAKLEIIPADEEGNKTVIDQLWIKFDEPIKDSFFSVQSLKRLR
ncbi:MAG TPA: outer membrane lipoprotein-sorting protein [Saprospiraceae bacterium]|nr:outer membrane lipoprotein-sorting protein [Saprospiraceae bacterium]